MSCKAQGARAMEPHLEGVKYHETTSNRNTRNHPFQPTAHTWSKGYFPMGFDPISLGANIDANTKANWAPNSTTGYATGLSESVPFLSHCDFTPTHLPPPGLPTSLDLIANLASCDDNYGMLGILVN
jgi:hypothetical protein